MFKRISMKITAAIMAVGLIISIALGGIIGYEVSNKVTEEALSKAEITVAQYTQSFNNDFTKIQTAVEMLGQNIKNGVDFNLAKTDPEYLANFTEIHAQKLIKSIADDLNYTSSVYVYFNSEYFGQAQDVWYLRDGQGQFIRQEKIPLDYYDGVETGDKEWFYGPVRSQKPRWTAPYISEAGDLITSYVQPVIESGQTVAIVGMDLNLADVQEQLKAQKLYDTGYLYMLDQNYSVIAHPELEMGTVLDQIDGGTEAMTAMGEKSLGHTILESNGISKITAFDHLDNGWIIASSIPLKEITKTVDALIYTMIVIAVGSVIVSIFVAVFVGRNISKPIIKVTQTIRQIKEGDFTAEVHVNSKDETRELADGLNDMVQSVRTLIENSKKVSVQMSEAATNLASMAEETSATSDEVARTVHEIADGATNQAQEADNGNRKAAELDKMFGLLIDDSKDMAENAEHALSISKQGSRALDKLKEKSEVSKTSNADVASAIEALDEKANSISSIIGTITSIAEQTNLLALNASIEAARAGEAGRGFAVVADEIRKLAENSSSAATQIHRIIMDIQNESRATVNIVKNLENITEEQNTSVDEVSGSIDRVFESIENITHRIDKVASQVTQLNDLKSEIVSAIEGISSVSEQTAAATEEVTASMEQQSMAIEEVAKSAESLNELSVELTAQINKFKI